MREQPSARQNPHERPTRARRLPSKTHAHGPIITFTQIIMLTDPGVGDLGDHLAHLYAAVWVEFAGRNPARAAVGCGGEAGGLQSAGPLFAAKLDAYLGSIGLL